MPRPKRPDPYLYTNSDDRKLVSLLENEPSFATKAHSNWAMSKIWDRVWKDFFEWWKEENGFDITMRQPSRSSLQSRWNHIKRQATKKQSHLIAFRDCEPGSGNIPPKMLLTHLEERI